jgi:hypothetical protein
MTTRDRLLKAHQEYQEAVKEAERKKPEGAWYRIPASDGSGEGRLIYDPAEDIIEVDLSGGAFKIPGKYLKSLQSALNTLMGD